MALLEGVTPPGMAPQKGPLWGIWHPIPRIPTPNLEVPNPGSGGPKPPIWRSQDP